MTIRIPDHYELLGVRKDASPEQIQIAFRDQMRKWHPDVNKTEEAQIKSRHLNNARDTLSDETKRRFYDQSLNPTVTTAGSEVKEKSPKPTSTSNDSQTKVNQTRAYAGSDWESFLRDLRKKTESRKRRAPKSPPKATLNEYQGSRLRIKSEILYRQSGLDASKACKCYRCNYLWFSKKHFGVPKRCPYCKSGAWNIRRIFRCYQCSHVWETGALHGNARYLFVQCPHCRSLDWHRPSFRYKLCKEKWTVRTGSIFGSIFASLECLLTGDKAA